MPSRRDLKNKVIKTAKQTAETAKVGLDQVLLRLEHPAVKRMADKVASPETKDMLTRLSQRIIDQADVVRASLDPAIFKPVADAVTEEAKKQIQAVKNDPKGSMVKARHAAGVVAKQAAKSARKLGTRAAQSAANTAKNAASGAVAKAKSAASKASGSVGRKNKSSSVSAAKSSVRAQKKSKKA